MAMAARVRATAVTIQLSLDVMWLSIASSSADRFLRPAGDQAVAGLRAAAAALAARKAAFQVPLDGVSAGSHRSVLPPHSVSQAPLAEFSPETRHPPLSRRPLCGPSSRFHLMAFLLDFIARFFLHAQSRRRLSPKSRRERKRGGRLHSGSRPLCLKPLPC